MAADNVVLIKGVFTRSITIKELEKFSKKENSKSILEKLVPTRDKEKVRDLINKDYAASIELTSKLMYTKIGNIILGRVSKIIYPLRHNGDPVAIVAIRAGTIKALADGNNKINLISFFKAYPNKSVAIDVTEASKVINKVESMAELVKFFTDSPLQQLKE